MDISWLSNVSATRNQYQDVELSNPLGMCSGQSWETTLWPYCQFWRWLVNRHLQHISENRLFDWEQLIWLSLLTWTWMSLTIWHCLRNRRAPCLLWLKACRRGPLRSDYQSYHRCHHFLHFLYWKMNQSRLRPRFPAFELARVAFHPPGLSTLS